MTVVAVAGGTSGLGRAIVEEFREHPEFSLFVLSRQEYPDLEKELGYPILAIDYDNPDEITQLLQDKNVEIVISCINYLTALQPEINLIKAADQAHTVTRYIPSIWGSFHYGPEQAHIPEIKPKLVIMDAMEKSRSLEYMAIYNGYFLDYYGVPHVKSYLTNICICVDMQSNVAGIPGSGDVPVTFTYTFDIAKFTIASLSLPKWPKESYIIGDKVTWNEFIQIAEEAKGVKFEIHRDSLEDLRVGKITELPNQKHVYESWPNDQARKLFSQFGLWCEAGMLDHRPAHSLNDDFPGIKPVTVREFLEKAWRK
ncbi:uncharacterized protein Z518_03517 [Rhinocladiella mackenziei CBS 650.93]|uniref:NmrA-like domain-containing protein n=1 Tax=Rhinocladiella mackenziei CBS 650.93 TaxID=1442369 RepID=A0A0D2JHP4_9EURO|nr:uncharacterized protein Z518_03517 [Rhinocladiella mackenziei CBS 650.93]KIX08860.1 hypothetical protein Z518_03517 [Rhinocladiella mackenziei CBS 650.93]